MGLFDQWNENKFSIYKSDEKTVLKLLESFFSLWFGPTLSKIDETDTLANDNKNNKVSYDDLHNKYKLSSAADFTGSWWGITKPVHIEGGIDAIVEQHDTQLKLTAYSQFFNIPTDGTDCTLAFQTMIKYCFDNQISDLYLEAGKTYTLDSNVSQCSILLYGKNLTIHGNGATIKKINATAGNWGDIIDICGLINNYTYPITGLYTSFDVPSENITIKDLIIECDTAIVNQPINNIGIINAKNITLENVTCKNASQTSFAVVCSNSIYPIDNLVFKNCVADGSRKHAYRISLQSTGDTLKVKMYNCKSLNSSGIETEPEIINKNCHLWYRASNDTDKVSLLVEDCYFDSTGQFITTNGARNLQLINTIIEGGFRINGAQGHENNVLIQGCKFKCNTIKTGAITEIPCFIQDIIKLKLLNNYFDYTLNDGYTGATNNLAINSCSDVLISGNENLSIRLATNVARNKNVRIDKNHFVLTSKQTMGSKSNMFASVDNLFIDKNVFDNGFMDLINNDKVEITNNNIVFDFNSGTNIFAPTTITTKYTVMGNYCKFGATMPASRDWLSTKVGNIDSGNIIEQTDGTLRSNITYSTAPQSSGYWIVGDRVINTTPTIGQPKSWICTASGTPGTWVSEGNL